VNRPTELSWVEAKPWRQPWQASNSGRKTNVRASNIGTNVAQPRKAQGQAAVEVEAQPLPRQVQESGGGAGGEARCRRGLGKTAQGIGAKLMALTLRPTGGHARIYRDRQDWTICVDGVPVGRLYEDTSASTSANLRWFWSITVYMGARTRASPRAVGWRPSARRGLMRSWMGLREAARELGTP
jgi:hypothetical protein